MSLFGNIACWIVVINDQIWNPGGHENRIQRDLILIADQLAPIVRASCVPVMD